MESAGKRVRAALDEENVDQAVNILSMLPQDVFWEIVSYLNTRDLLKLCSTNTAMKNMCNQNIEIWNDVLRRNFGNNAETIQELQRYLTEHFPNAFTNYDSPIIVMLAYFATSIVYNTRLTGFVERAKALHLNPPHPTQSNPENYGGITIYKLYPSGDIEFRIETIGTTSVFGVNQIKVDPRVQNFAKLLLNYDPIGVISRFYLARKSLIRDTYKFIGIFTVLFELGYTLKYDRNREIKSKICSNCSTNAAAQMCIDCDIVLCESCAALH
jgi:hypothetical protein